MMRTSGHSNDTPMILAPIVVAVVVGFILFDGPVGALLAVAGFAVDIARFGVELARAVVVAEYLK